MKLIFYRNKQSGKIEHCDPMPKAYENDEMKLQSLIDGYNKNENYNRECFLKELTETEQFLYEAFKSLAQVFEDLYNSLSDVKSKVEYLQCILLGNEMKSVLISIHPKYCELISNGKKTVEVRKTKPQLDVPFKCYIYETQGVTETPWIDEDGHYIFKGRGQVIGEFVCDTIISHCEMANADIAEIQGCIKREKLLEYSNGKELFGWHITDLVIYDKPKELEWFRQCHKCEYYARCFTHDYSCDGVHKLTRPPQSWLYVEELGGVSMICANCKKEIDISFGQAFWNGCYCESCAKNLQKPKTNFDRITESVESLAEWIERLDVFEFARFSLNKQIFKEWLQKECEG